MDLYNFFMNLNIEMSCGIYGKHYCDLIKKKALWIEAEKNLASYETLGSGPRASLSNYNKLHTSIIIHPHNQGLSFQKDL